LEFDLVISVIAIIIAILHYFADYYIFKKKEISNSRFLGVCTLIILVISFIFDKLYYIPWSFASIYHLSIGFILVLIILTLIRIIRKKIKSQVVKKILYLVLLIIYFSIYYINILLIYSYSNLYVRNNYAFEVRNYDSACGVLHSNIVYVYKNGKVKVQKNNLHFGKNEIINEKLSNKYDYETIFNTIKKARDDSNSEEAISKRQKLVQEERDSFKDDNTRFHSNPINFETVSGYRIRFNGEADGEILYSDYITQYNLEEIFKEIEKYTDETLFY